MEKIAPILTHFKDILRAIYYLKNLGVAQSKFDKYNFNGKGTINLSQNCNIFIQEFFKLLRIGNMQLNNRNRHFLKEDGSF